MSLQFLTMRGTNFCTLLDLPPFALSGRGMVLILGDNQDAAKADSNGAGKSLLLELFVWTLWGKTIRGLAADDVVNDVVQKNCFGEVLFTVGGHTYTVRPYRCHDVNKGDKTVNQKEHDLVLLRDGLPHATEGKVAETQENINQLLGITFPIFEAMMPGTGIKAAAMGDAGIKALLEAILQTEIYSVAEKLTKGRLKKVQAVLEHNGKAQQAAEDAIDKLEEDIDWNKNLLATFTENRKKRVDKAYEELAAVCGAIDGYNDTIDDLEDQLGSLATEEQWIEEVGKVASLKEELRAYKEEVRGMLSGFRDEWNRLQPEQDQLHILESRIATLGPECLECRQSVGEEYREGQVAEIAAQRAPLVVKLQENEEEQAKINRVFYDLVQKFDKGILDTAVQADTLRKQYKEGLDVASTIQSLQAQRQAQRDQIPRIEEATQEGNQEVEHTANRLEELLDQLEDKQMLLAILDVDIEEKQKKAKALEFWLHGYSTKGIRSHVLKSVTPVLNEITRKNCVTLTGSEMTIVFNTQTTLGNGEVREKFDIQVKQAHGGNSYKKNSTGEKERADLIIAMSLADLAAMRTNFPFRFLDEIGSGVDEAGTDAMVSLLRQYESAYSTVFVITHREQLKAMFAKPLTMVKVGGVSRLEGDSA